MPKILRIIASFGIAFGCLLAVIGVHAVLTELARPSAAAARRRAEAHCTRQGGRIISLASGDWWCDIPRTPCGTTPERPAP